MHRIFQRKSRKKNIVLLLKIIIWNKHRTVLCSYFFSSFPGGKLDPYDLSLEWPKYLSSTINIERFSKKIADIYKDIDHPYPGLVFRLCAIRETFEETGLLLAKPRTSLNSSQ